MNSVIVPQAACYPTNGLFIDPLRPLFNQFTGGIGGLILPVASILVMVAAILGLVRVFRSESAGSFISVVWAIILVIVVLIGFFLLVGTVLTALNDLC